MINIGTCVNYFCNPSIFDNTENRKPVEVAFCIPGSNFTPGFFNSWTHLLFFMKDNPKLITPHYTNFYSPNIYALRNSMLGGKNNGNKFQIPLEDDYNTKYIFFIDSDMVFNPMQVVQMIYKMEVNNLDVLSSLYYMGDAKHLTVIKDDSEDILSSKGSFDYYTLDELQNLGNENNSKICEVSNVGLGFVCVRTEVFKNISYPWFEPEFFDNLMGFYNDDLSFFRKIKKAGYKIFCDTTLIVGHDKNITLK